MKQIYCTNPILRRYRARRDMKTCCATYYYYLTAITHRGARISIKKRKSELQKFSKSKELSLQHLVLCRKVKQRLMLAWLRLRGFGTTTTRLSYKQKPKETAQILDSFRGDQWGVAPSLPAAASWSSPVAPSVGFWFIPTSSILRLPLLWVLWVAHATSARFSAPCLMITWSATELSPAQ
jgi:hypothetical protein